MVDEETLEPAGVGPRSVQPPRFPKGLTKTVSGFPGMRTNWSEDIGEAPDPSGLYVLRWETLGSNRDRPRKGQLPENSDLVLYKIGGSH